MSQEVFTIKVKKGFKKYLKSVAENQGISTNKFAYNALKRASKFKEKYLGCEP